MQDAHMVIGNPGTWAILAFWCNHKEDQQRSGQDLNQHYSMQ